MTDIRHISTRQLISLSFILFLSLLFIAFLFVEENLLLVLALISIAYIPTAYTLINRWMFLPLKVMQDEIGREYAVVALSVILGHL